MALTAAPGVAGAAGPGRGDAQRAQQALEHVQDLLAGIGVRTGRELTPALAELERRRRALDPPGRRAARAILARPTDGAGDPQGDGYSVAEATPFCTAHFCVHYVTSTTDAPSLADSSPANGVPDYVEQMADVFENEVFPCENGFAALGCADAAETGMGWPEAPSDGSLGGDGRFDVYLKQIGNQGIYGYVAPDPQPSGSSLYSYLVMDDDYAEFGYPDPLLPLRVTAAHEYNHVLQFGIESFQDTWMFESTATWAEEKVYPAIDDYLLYLNSWVASTADPLTDANGGGGLKMYGSAVWNHFIDGRWGRDTILDAWVASTEVNGGPFAPASYETALVANGGSTFVDEFEDFSAATAEWRTPGSGFPDLYPAVPRDGSLTTGAAGTTIRLDHTTFSLRGVTVPSSPASLTLNATLPSGLQGAIALVGRTGGSDTAGTVTKQIARTTAGGALSVTLDDAQGYGRITAVLINADPTQTGWSIGKNDWNFSKDRQSFSGVRVVATAPPTPPSATTTAATSVTSTGATLNGSVNPNGSATTYWFEYGPTTAYGTETAHTSAGSGTSESARSAAVGGLSSGTAYHFRIVAQNSVGTTFGSDQSFTTPLDPPVVTTAAASAVGVSGATLNGSVNPRGKATTYWFEYGTTTSYGSQVPLAPADAGSGTTAVDVSQAITGLSGGTTYHYRLVAMNADGTTLGSDQSFTTLQLPEATTTAATSITKNGATLNGSVDPNGSATTYWFEYGATTAYGGETAHQSAGSGSSPLAQAAAISGLAEATTYHFRIVAQSAAGIVNGLDQSFTTLAPPVVTTSAASAVGVNGATLNGSVDPRGKPTTYLFEYGPTTAYGSQVPLTPASAGSGTTAVAVSQAITGLARGTTYHYRLVATNADGTTNGGDQTFTTLDPPIVTTGGASSISISGATLGGSVNPRGKATTYWFEYGPTTSYGSQVPLVPADAGSGTTAVDVSQAVSGLDEGTTYHYRLVATNADGTTSGGDQTFTTLQLPAAVSAAAGDITTDAATLNGSVDPNGSATTYWFEYGTTTAYGGETTHEPAGAGSSAVPVSASIGGLAPATTYHFRLVADSPAGQVAGDDQTFTTLGPPLVSTDPATAVGVSGATLNGSVDPRGKPTTYFFEYGPTTAYGTQVPLTPASAGSGTTAVAVSQAITGLARGTNYHFRLVATNADGITSGGDQTFTTLDPPIAVTEAAESVSSFAATLTGSVDPRGQATSYHFDYGTTAAYGSQTAEQAAGSGSDALAVSAQVDGLPADTVVHYRLVAGNGDGVAMGDDATFRTAPAPADDGSGAAAGDGGTTATGGGGGEAAPAGEVQGVTIGAGSEEATAELAPGLAVARARLARVLRRGLLVRAGCEGRCALTVRVVIPKRLARRLHLKRTIARGKRRIDAGMRRVRLRFPRRTRRALRGRRALRVVVVLVVTDASGERERMTRRINLRR